MSFRQDFFQQSDDEIIAYWEANPQLKTELPLSDRLRYFRFALYENRPALVMLFWRTYPNLIKLYNNKIVRRTLQTDDRTRKEDYLQLEKLGLTQISLAIWQNSKKVRDWFCGFEIVKTKIDTQSLINCFELALRNQQGDVYRAIWHTNCTTLGLWYSGRSVNVGTRENPVHASATIRQTLDVFKLAIANTFLPLVRSIASTSYKELLIYYQQMTSQPMILHDFIFYAQNNYFDMADALKAMHPTVWARFCGNTEYDDPAEMLLKNFILSLSTKKSDYYAEMWNGGVKLQACVKQLDKLQGRALLRLVKDLNDPAFYTQFVDALWDCEWFSSYVKPPVAEKRRAESDEAVGAPPAKLLRTESGSSSPTSFKAALPGYASPAEVGFFSETLPTASDDLNFDFGDFPLLEFEADFDGDQFFKL